jgi:hypothetical protein
MISFIILCKNAITNKNRIRTATTMDVIQTELIPGMAESCLYISSFPLFLKRVGPVGCSNKVNI